MRGTPRGPESPAAPPPAKDRLQLYPGSRCWLDDVLTTSALWNLTFEALDFRTVDP